MLANANEQYIGDIYFIQKGMQFENMGLVFDGLGKFEILFKVKCGQGTGNVKLY